MKEQSRDRMCSQFAYLFDLYYMVVECLYICKPQFLVAQGVELKGIVGWAGLEDMSYTMTSSLIYPTKGGRRQLT